MSSIRPRNYEEVIISNHPTLAEVCQQSNQWTMLTLAYVAATITDYLDFIGRRNTMNDQQVAQTATLITEEYGERLHFDDLPLFFRFAKLGRYGHLYDLNGVVILENIRQYLNERSSAEYERAICLEREAKEAEEARRQAEWDALTPAEKAEQQAKIQATIARIQAKFNYRAQQQREAALHRQRNQEAMKMAQQ